MATVRPAKSRPVSVLRNPALLAFVLAGAVAAALAAVVMTLGATGDPGPIQPTPVGTAIAAPSGEQLALSTPEPPTPTPGAPTAAAYVPDTPVPTEPAETPDASAPVATSAPAPTAPPADAGPTPTPRAIRPPAEVESAPARTDVAAPTAAIAPTPAPTASAPAATLPPAEVLAPVDVAAPPAAPPPTAPPPVAPGDGAEDDSRPTPTAVVVPAAEPAVVAALPTIGPVRGGVVEAPVVEVPDIQATVEADVAAAVERAGLPTVRPSSPAIASAVRTPMPRPGVRAADNRDDDDRRPNRPGRNRGGDDGDDDRAEDNSRIVPRPAVPAPAPARDNRPGQAADQNGPMFEECFPFCEDD